MRQINDRTRQGRQRTKPVLQLIADDPANARFLFEKEVDNQGWSYSIFYAFGIDYMIWMQGTNHPTQFAAIRAMCDRLAIAVRLTKVSENKKRINIWIRSFRQLCKNAE